MIVRSCQMCWCSAGAHVIQLLMTNFGLLGGQRCHLSGRPTVRADELLPGFIVLFLALAQVGPGKSSPALEIRFLQTVRGLCGVDQCFEIVPGNINR